MLIELSLLNLRIVEQAKLMPCAGVNLITGSNGSGKTTLLEAVYLLSRGRSFRHREAAPLIREGQQETILTTRFKTLPSGSEHFLGMRRTRSELEVRLDGKPASKRSAILKMLPVQWIGPEPQLLLTGSPEVRRAFLDNGLFHVEHRYLNVLQQYNRVLEQRNAGLRQQARGLEVWDEQLSRFADELDGYRSRYVRELKQRVSERLLTWNLDVDHDISYRRGWRADQTLAQQLLESREADRKQRFTGAGPHRADLVLKSANLRSGRRLSRGQLKMLAVALYFAQSEINRQVRGATDILLFDDLSAELDRDNRHFLLKDIQKGFEQSFITALSEDDLPIPRPQSTMFHVEHGVFHQP
jgi:DNA replication and repair protein RecF